MPLEAPRNHVIAGQNGALGMIRRSVVGEQLHRLSNSLNFQRQYWNNGPYKGYP